MALGDPYLTDAELKARLGIADTDDDTRITAAVASASDGINDFAKRDFQKNTTASARTYRPTHSRLVIVHDFYTTAGLVVKTDEDDDGTFETTIAASDYELEPLDGVVNGREGWPFWKIRLVNGSQFPDGLRAGVQVTVPWGWAAVPPPVKEATFVLAEDLFKLRDTPFGVGGFGDFGRIRARENPFVAMMIGPYRRNKIRVA